MKGYKRNKLFIPDKKKAIANNKNVAEIAKASKKIEKTTKEIMEKKKESKKSTKKQEVLSNHDRIIQQRAKKLNLTVEQYKKQYIENCEEK